MPVIIDGNNLLYAARSAPDEGPLMGRSRLCNLLGQWVRRRAERVHVVFDGPAPTDDLVKQIAAPGVQISFSGGVSADAEIIRLLEEDSAARRQVVVSSDREIVRAAKRRRASPVGSDEFWALLRQELSRPAPRRVEPPEKTRGQSPEATSEWLREFGFDTTG